MTKNLKIPYLLIVTAAILIRLILMPILFHPDIKSQYFHAEFLSQGVFNIYEFIKKNQPYLAYKDTFNYPPLTYYFLGSYAFLTQPVLEPELKRWVNDWGTDRFQSPNLFRILFTLKLPYLILDIILGYLLINFVEVKKRKNLLVLWLFNPISIYIIYGLSNFDLIPAFFTVLSIFFILKDKPKLGGLAFGLAIALKLYPLLFLPFILARFFYLKKTNSFIWFLFLSILPLFTSIVFIFYDFMSIQNSGLTQKFLEMKINLFNIFHLPVFLIICGITFLLYIYELVKGKTDFKTLFYFLTILLLGSFTITEFHGQWLIWVLPFLLIVLTEFSGLWIGLLMLWVSLIILMLSLQDNFLLVGLFTPIIPNISSIPTLDNIIFSHIKVSKIMRLGEITFGLGTLIIVLNYYKSSVLQKLSIKNFSKFLLPTLITLNLLFFGGLFLIGVFFTSKLQLDSAQLIDTGADKFFKDHDVVQPVHINHDNISNVYIKLKNINLVNQDPFTFSLTKDNQTLRELKLNGYNVGDDNMVRFKFEPLTQVASSNLAINLKSETVASASALYRSFNPEHTLVYKIYYQDSLINTLKEIVGGYLHLFIIDPVFTIFYIALFVLLAVIWIQRKKYE